jgi:hypothetical protein
VRVRVVSRIPPLPWEPGYWSPGVRVRLEAGLTPEAGPLEFLRSIWPERYVEWSAEHQLWEVRQLNPVTGHDERVELLRRMATAPDGGQVPAYLPFDYDWLQRRAKNRQEFLALGPEKYDDLVQERNRQRSSAVMHDAIREMAAGMRELVRYPGKGKWVPVGGILTPPHPRILVVPSPST